MRSYIPSVVMSTLLSLVPLMRFDKKRERLEKSAPTCMPKVVCVRINFTLRTNTLTQEGNILVG